MDSKLDWLPPHQTHVLYTLAQVDRHIDLIANALFDFTSAGTMELENVLVTDRVELRVSRVAPIPEIVSRTVADALTQLRAALEHVLFAEVEHSKSRPLSEAQARSLEMPAATTPEGFEKWLAHPTARRRQLLSPNLIERLRILQPSTSPDPHAHSLSALVDYTNHAKHRAPAVAATLLGRVIVETPRPQILPVTIDRPLRAGDVLARTPPGVVLPVSIYPAVSLRRPKRGTWSILMHELGAVENWVRTQAIPILVTGKTDLPELPASVPFETGFRTRADALADAEYVPAYERNSSRMQVAVLRESLPETFAFSGNLDIIAARELVRSMADSQVLGSADLLQTMVSTGDPLKAAAALREHIDRLRVDLEVSPPEPDAGGSH